MASTHTYVEILGKLFCSLSKFIIGILFDTMQDTLWKLTQPVGCFRYFFSCIGLFGYSWSHTSGVGFTAPHEIALRGGFEVFREMSIESQDMGWIGLVYRWFLCTGLCSWLWKHWGILFNAKGIIGLSLHWSVEKSNLSNSGPKELRQSEVPGDRLYSVLIVLLETINWVIGNY